MKCLKCSFDLGKRSRGGNCKKCGFEFSVRKGTYMTPGIGVLWDAWCQANHDGIASSDDLVTLEKLRDLLRSPTAFMAPLEATITASPDRVHAVERAVAKQIGDALLACNLQTMFYSFAWASAAIGLSRIDLQRRNHENQLLAWQISGVVSGVSTLCCGSSCAACVAASRKCFTIGEALKIAPLPCIDCSFRFGGENSVPFCRCCYVAILTETD